jgi:hypothetical protein
MRIFENGKETTLCLIDLREISSKANKELFDM